MGPTACKVFPLYVNCPKKTELGEKYMGKLQPCNCSWISCTILPKHTSDYVTSTIPSERIKRKQVKLSAAELVWSGSFWCPVPGIEEHLGTCAFPRRKG